MRPHSDGRRLSRGGGRGRTDGRSARSERFIRVSGTRLVAACRIGGSGQRVFFCGTQQRRATVSLQLVARWRRGADVEGCSSPSAHGEAPAQEPRRCRGICGRCGGGGWGQHGPRRAEGAAPEEERPRQPHPARRRLGAGADRERTHQRRHDGADQGSLRCRCVGPPVCVYACAHQ